MSAHLTMFRRNAKPSMKSAESTQQNATLLFSIWFRGSMQAKRQNSSNVIASSQFRSSRRIILHMANAECYSIAEHKQIDTVQLGHLASEHT